MTMNGTGRSNNKIAPIIVPTITNEIKISLPESNIHFVNNNIHSLLLLLLYI